MKDRWRVCVPLALCLLSAARVAAQKSAGATTAFDIPPWAFPTTSPGVARLRPRLDSVAALHVPNGERSHTLAEVRDALNPPDWFPASHPAAPAVVLHARPDNKYACGLCHLPDGQGRSENATIAGLPQDYFLRQVADIRSGARHSAVKDWAPSANMTVAVLNLTNEEAVAAATYFGGLRVKTRYRVVERARIPATYELGGLLAPRLGADSEPIAGRLMELSNDMERHELRDPGETFTTFVPPGSIASGRRIAVSAPFTSASRCATCHGLDLGGIGVVPPIAGRSPAYILRQLIAFRTGARSTSASGPMQLVAAMLSLGDMVAVAAYAGSRVP